MLSPTAKQLQSSLKLMESTTVREGLSIGGRVFMLISDQEGLMILQTSVGELKRVGSELTE